VLQGMNKIVNGLYLLNLKVHACLVQCVKGTLLGTNGRGEGEGN